MIPGFRCAHPGYDTDLCGRIRPEEMRMQIESERVDLAAGMATTVEIKTGQRRIIEYRLSPLPRHRQGVRASADRNQKRATPCRWRAKSHPLSDGVGLVSQVSTNTHIKPQARVACCWRKGSM